MNVREEKQVEGRARTREDMAAAQRKTETKEIKGIHVQRNTRRVYGREQEARKEREETSSTQGGWTVERAYTGTIGDIHVQKVRRETSLSLARIEKTPNTESDV